MATVAELRALKTKYETALDKALEAESYGIAGRSVSRAKVADLQKQIDVLDARISRMISTGIGIDPIEPRFIPGGS